MNEYIYTALVRGFLLPACFFALMFSDMLYLILCYVEPSGSEWCLPAYVEIAKQDNVSDSLESRGKIGLSQSKNDLCLENSSV